MKILGIACSPRKQGNTVALLEEVLRGSKQEGTETELYSVFDKTIKPCQGCRTCWETGECPLEDDMQDLGNRMVEADGIVFGTPIYFYTMTAQAKAIMDRTIALNQPDRNLNNKVCGVVTCAGSLGLADVLKDYSFYIIGRQMLPAFQVSTYAGSPEDLRKMEKCMKALNDMGRQMVALVKLGFKYPVEFVKGPGAFGTHTR